MSVADHAALPLVERAQRFGKIIVVGGGCYGSYYVRQLMRARSAGAIDWRELLVVDRDEHCAVASSIRARGDGQPPDIHVVAADWREFFERYLGKAACDRDASRADAIVPSPLMPHLMFDWLMGRARARWPDRDVAAEPLLHAPDTPWRRAAPDGTHYVSFAEWICPINCIEPRLCPHTRDLRTWSLPRTAHEYVEQARSRGEPLAGPVILHCVHRAYGVGMFGTSEVLEGDDLVRVTAEGAAAEILVGTMSHCHGAFARLVIGQPARGSTHWTH